MKTIKVEMLMAVEDGFVNAAKKWEHHIEYLIDTGEYPEIKAITDVTVTPIGKQDPELRATTTSRPVTAPDTRPTPRTAELVEDCMNRFRLGAISQKEALSEIERILTPYTDLLDESLKTDEDNSYRYIPNVIMANMSKREKRDPKIIRDEI